MEQRCLHILRCVRGKSDRLYAVSCYSIDHSSDLLLAVYSGKFSSW